MQRASLGSCLPANHTEAPPFYRRGQGKRCMRRAGGQVQRASATGRRNKPGGRAAGAGLPARPARPAPCTRPSQPARLQPHLRNRASGSRERRAAASVGLTAPVPNAAPIPAAAVSSTPSIASMGHPSRQPWEVASRVGKGPPAGVALGAITSMWQADTLGGSRGEGRAVGRRQQLCARVRAACGRLGPAYSPCRAEHAASVRQTACRTATAAAGGPAPRIGRHICCCPRRAARVCSQAEAC